MALKLILPENALPVRADGTIDGFVPVRFEDHGDSWSLHIGPDWRYEALHDLSPVRRTGRGIVSSIYHAVACYRDAMRDLDTAVPV